MRLVYIALAWAAGIIVSAAMPRLLPWPLLTLGLLIVGLMVARLRRAPMIAVVAVAFALGGLRFSLLPPRGAVAQYNHAGGLTVTGRVESEPDVRDSAVEVRVEAESVTRAGATTPTDGLVLVEAPRDSDVRYGDRISATGLLATPGEYDTFSYADYLARGGVYSLMRSAAVSVEARGDSTPIAALIEARQTAAGVIAHSLPEPAASLLAGILLGLAAGLPPSVQGAFVATGTAHIIAISGFNMAILAGLATVTLRRLRVPPRLSVLIAILLLAAYTLLIGANAAVLRAALMSSLLVIAPLVRRKTYIPASLAFAALVLSAFNPTVLWDLSFQLSLFATLGIALFSDGLAAPLERGLARLVPSGAAGLTGSFIVEPLAVSTAALIATLPLTILLFGRFSPLSLLVNLLIEPVQPALMVLGALAVVVTLIVPPLGQVLFWLDFVLLQWTLTVVRSFARLPFISAALTLSPNVIALFFMLLIGGAMLHATQPAWVLALARFARRRLVFFTVILAGLGMALLVVAVALARPDGQLHVWFLDMGQSNAVLASTPGGAHVLIDGGRFPSRLLGALGDRLPFDKTQIDVLALTQPDENEYAALSAVLERYGTGIVLTNGQPNLSESFQMLSGTLATRQMVTVKAGYALDFGDGTRLEMLSPTAQPELGDSLDDNALVFRLSYGAISFLLTSDLSAAGQAALLRSGQWPLATVMQLPAHGAVRSLDDDFLAAVQPSAVVMQNDPASRFGADPDTLAQLGSLPLYRTDQGGTVHMWTDGHDLSVAQDEMPAR